MKPRQPIYTNGEEPLTLEEAKAILISRGYNPDAVGKRMNTVAQQALKIVELEQTNTALLDVVKDCVNFLADLNTAIPFDAADMVSRAKALHKRAYTAHAKYHADTLKGG